MPHQKKVSKKSPPPKSLSITTSAIGEGGVSRARLGASTSTSSSSSSSLASKKINKLPGNGPGINRAARLSKKVKEEVKPKKRSRHMPTADKNLPAVRIKKEIDITAAHEAANGHGSSSSSSSSGFGSSSTSSGGGGGGGGNSGSGGGGGGGGGSGGGGSNSSSSSSRRPRATSVGDQQPSSPMRRQGAKTSQAINKTRAKPAARKRRLGVAAQAKLDQQEKARHRLSQAGARGSVTGGEWPPRVGQTSDNSDVGDSVYAPMSMPFLLDVPDEDSSDDEDTTDSTSSSSKKKTKKGGFGSINNAKIEIDRCSAFADIDMNGMTSQVMLMQIPHLPNFDVLRFGASVGKDGGAKEESGNSSSSSSSSVINIEEEEDDDASNDQIKGPRVGCDRGINDKFLGSGATRHHVPIEQSVRRAREGRIGTLKVYKSGRTELIFGDMPLRVVDGPACSSYHELVYLQTKQQNDNAMDEDKDDDVNEGDGNGNGVGDDDNAQKEPLPADSPTLCFLGPVGSRVNLVPDIKWLLKQGGGTVLDPNKSGGGGRKKNLLVKSE